jgi:hypothetical protein
VNSAGPSGSRAADGGKATRPRKMVLCGEVGVSGPAVGTVVYDPVEELAADPLFAERDVARELPAALVAEHEQAQHGSSREGSAQRFI